MTQRIFPVEYEWGRLLDLVGLAVGLWLVSRFLPATGWAIAAKGGLWLAWPLLVWVCGLPSSEEKEYAFAALRQTWAKLAAVKPPADDDAASRGPAVLVIPESEGEEMAPVEAAASAFNEALNGVVLKRFHGWKPRFLGGMLNRPAADAAGAGWRADCDGGEAFLRANAAGCRLFTWGSLAVLIRGYVAAGARRPRRTPRRRRRRFAVTIWNTATWPWTAWKAVSPSP